MNQKLLVDMSLLLGLSITAFLFYETKYLLAFLSLLYYVVNYYIF